MADRRGLRAAGAAGVMVTALLAAPAPCFAQGADPVSGFLGNIFKPSPPAVTGSVTPVNLPPSGGVREWSGQSGSSGHPLMTADAIREAAANFPRCLESMWPDAARRGVSRQTFDTHLASMTPDLRIADLMDAQPEFNKAFWEYLDLLVSEARIKRGREILAQHKAVFDAVEKAYGVDRHIVAAIWGIESNFSTAIGERSVLRSTATAACVGRRQAYFKNEFLVTLEIVQSGDVRPDHLKGSWAGAFGPTQFMPSAFKRFAVDFDGDGRRDVVDSVPDLIASTANKFRLDGWIAGQTWGYEVALPQGFNYLHADSSKNLTVAEWTRLGVARANGKPFLRPTDKAYLLVPAGARGPAFLMLNNFRAIMRYNPSEAYAMAIGHLADRMRGEGPFLGAWPRDERSLSSAERYEMQSLLVRRGYDIGGAPNGRIGARSRAAIKQFQATAGLIPDGFASAAILDQLRR